MSSCMEVDIFHQSADFVERFGKCISKDLKESSKTQILDDLVSYVLYFSKSADFYEASDKILEDMVEEIESASDELDFKDVLAKFDEKIKKVEKEVMAKEEPEKYTNLKELFSTNDSKTDEITAISETLNTIDPITKLPITDPVKNVKCGHVYERGTIIEIILKNPRTKCPIAGCSNAEFLKKRHLVPDLSKKKMIGVSDGICQKKRKQSQ